ncbi:hypothetical protein ACFRFJ_17060 [Streptomyces hydrogenans]|uniref:hypothetical protein n=1 Tax=Streptomyces hydrogenans TaxID=1873719 RepID=UPI0036A7508E
MTARRLRVLIQGLPPQSATKTAMRNALSDEELAGQVEDGEPEKGAWSQTDLLLATVHDAVRRVEHVLICVNSEKGKRPPAPEPMRRPGVARKKKAAAKLDTAGADWLFQMLNPGG